MKHVILILLLAFCISASGQVYNTSLNAYGYKFKRVKIDSTFTLPQDTVLRSNLTDAGAICYQVSDKSLYLWDGNKWNKITSATSLLALDSAYRSADSIIFHKTTGGTIGVKLNNIPQSGVTGLTDSISGNTLQRVTERGNSTSVNSNFNGGINAAGNLNIGLITTSRIRMMRFVDLIGNAPDSSNGAFITWLKSNGTRVGAIGDGSSTDNDLYFSALNNNNIRFSMIVTDTPFAPAKLPLVLRPDGSSLFNYSTTAASLGANFMGLNGNMLVENFTNKAAFITFSDNTTPEKAYVGKLGNPEANLTINMDYTTRIHKMDDSSKPALWLALSNRNASWALQYANAGQSQSQSPSYDVWTNSTKPYLFRQDTIEARFYNRLRVDSGLFVRQAAGTYKFFIQRTDQLQGLGISAGSGRLLLNNYDSVNSVFPDYQFLSTKGTVTKLVIFANGTTGFTGIGPSATPNSTLDVQGSASFNVRTIATATTFAADDFYLNINNTTNIIVTLPTAVGVRGRTYNIKKTTNNANTITFNTTSGQTIDGSASGVLSIGAFNDSRTFYSDGANWFIK